MKGKTEGNRVLPITRRRFVQGIAAGAVLSACAWKAWPVFGATAQPNSPVLTGSPGVQNSA
jgi:anaerobic selenocysteine-containing dehydrogenase